MAQWLRFTADYDHEWPTRAVTAFKSGMTVFVKAEVAQAALGRKVAIRAKKPAEGSTPTPTKSESRRIELND